MLAHVGPEAAQVHQALVLASLSRGLLDLHGLVSAHLAFCAAHGRPAMAASAQPWALSALGPESFATDTLELVPPKSRAGAEAPRRKGERALTFPQLLVTIDAWVALAADRARSRTDAGAGAASAATQPSPATASLSAREQQTLAAAERAPNFPRIELHASFTPASAHARGAARGRRLLAALEAAGAAERPCFLWFGSPIFVDALSPYLREVGFALGQAGPAALAKQGIAVPPNATPGQLVELLQAASTDVAAERAQREASAGFSPISLGDHEAIMVDLPRVPAEGCAPPAHEFLHKARAWQAVAVSVPWNRSHQNGVCAAPDFELSGTLGALSAHVPLAGLAIDRGDPLGDEISNLYGTIQTTFGAAWLDRRLSTLALPPSLRVLRTDEGPDSAWLEAALSTFGQAPCAAR